MIGLKEGRMMLKGAFLQFKRSLLQNSWYQIVNIQCQVKSTFPLQISVFFHTSLPFELNNKELKSPPPH